jgi:hypothetical protein
MRTSLVPTDCTIGFNAPSCFGCKQDLFGSGVQTEYVNLRSLLYSKPDRNSPSPMDSTRQAISTLHFSYSFNTNVIILYIF